MKLLFKKTISLFCLLPIVLLCFTSCNDDKNKIDPIYDLFVGEWSPPEELDGAAHLNFMIADGEPTYFYSSHPYPISPDDIDAGFFSVDGGNITFVNGKTNLPITKPYQFSASNKELTIGNVKYTKL